MAKQTYESLLTALVSKVAEDVEAVFEKGNKAAGRRVNKLLREEVKPLIKQLKKEITEVIKTKKNK